MAYWATLPEPDTEDPQAIEGLAAMGQHGVDKVEQAAAGGFRTNEAAAKGESLAGEDALGAAGEASSSCLAM